MRTIVKIALVLLYFGGVIGGMQFVSTIAFGIALAWLE